VRYVYATLVALLAGMVVVFQLQNFASVTVSFLWMHATLPLGLVVTLTYFLGMATGGVAVALIRSWMKAARGHSAPGAGPG